MSSSDAASSSNDDDVAPMTSTTTTPTSPTRKKTLDQQVRLILKACQELESPAKGLFASCKVIPFHHNENGIAPNGQGRMRVWYKPSDDADVKGKYFLATRLVFMHAKGWKDWQGDKDKVISHLCDVPNCCEVSHMQLVTQAENVQRRGCAGYFLLDKTTGEGIKACHHMPPCARVTVVDNRTRALHLEPKTAIQFANAQAEARDLLAQHVAREGNAKAEKQRRQAQQRLEKQEAKKRKSKARFEKRIARKVKKQTKELEALQRAQKQLQNGC